jgi:hypothetical protein
MQVAQDAAAASISRADPETGSGILSVFRRCYSNYGAQAGYALTVVALLIGWLGREERPLRAEAGAGYWLGVAGASMMALLLLYPLRKRVRVLQCLGATRHWFRLHMMLGVLGPTLILYHCNFELGSLNSRVALFCTLLVATSGLVGRYFYARIHLGLYGRRASLEELASRARMTVAQKRLATTFVPELLERIGAYDDRVLRPPEGMLSNILLPVGLAVRTRWARLRLTRMARREIRRRAATSQRVASERRRIEVAISRLIAGHLRRVRQVAAFSCYERLFSLWHVFHLPFFFILVLAAGAHVLAVHMY